MDDAGYRNRWRGTARRDGRQKARRLSRVVCLLLSALPLGAPAKAETITLGATPPDGAFVAESLDAGSVIDARRTVFTVANSGTPDPAEGRDCETGPLRVNPYPLRIDDSAGPALLGGLFAGEVPLGSDWVHTYCNSAAVQLRDSPDATVSGMRARRVWDAVRLAGASGGFRVEGAWLSEVRDDCIENDYLLGGTVRDSLLDGCFVGLSVRPWEEGGAVTASGTVALDGVLMRLEPYRYRGEIRHGFPIKADEASPTVAIHGSVIAMGDARSVSESRLNAAWAKIGACGGNLFLWISDSPYPGDLVPPPPCFEILTGEAAREAWAGVRQNWIDCHPEALRFPDDPASDPSRCRPDAYGGRG